jgi:hypothetical protein
MTIEELQAARTAILMQMSQPQDVRGPGGMGATNRSIEDLQRALSSIDAEIASQQGSTVTSIGRFYTNEGL